MSSERSDERGEVAPDEDPARAVHVGSLREEPPTLDFSGFVLSLAQTVMIEIGEAPRPGAGYPEPDLGMARQSIDILAMLSEKTAGNLTPAEARLIEDTLYQVRMSYCRAKKEAL